MFKVKKIPSYDSLFTSSRHTPCWCIRMTFCVIGHPLADGSIQQLCVFVVTSKVTYFVCNPDNLLADPSVRCFVRSAFQEPSSISDWHLMLS